LHIRKIRQRTDYLRNLSTQDQQGRHHWIQSHFKYPRIWFHMIEGEPPHNKSDYRSKNDKHIDRRCDECKGERRKVFRLLVVISCECIRPIEGQHLHIYHITIKDIRCNNHR